ncbi:MAG: prolyl oligopeptidase family serine peptidase [Acidobacteriota bacterium]
MQRLKLVVPTAIVLALVLAPATVRAEGSPTLEQIMADPLWIGKTPQRPYWSADSTTIYYEQDREGENDDDLLRVERRGGEPTVIEGDTWATVDRPDGAWSADRRRYAFVRFGDVFVRDITSGTLRQITRTGSFERDVLFLTDGRLAFRRDGQFFAVDLDGDGPLTQLTDVRTTDDPDDEADADDYLSQQQPRLFEWIADRQQRRDVARQRERQRQVDDPTAPGRPIYLGDDVEIEWRSLSPSGRAMVVSTRPAKRDKGRNDQMPSYVSDDGYVEALDVRPKVGTAEAWTDTVWLLDLATGHPVSLDLADLPGITDDPLAHLKADTVGAAESTQPTEDDTEDETSEGESSEDEPEPRPVRLEETILWSTDGRHAALHLHSYDNKDRWTVLLDISTLSTAADEDDEPTTTLAPELVHHLSNPDGWINWSFNEFDWLDDRRLWFLSEESGSSQLFLHDAESDTTRPLAAGSLLDGAVVADPQASPAGDWLYVQANPEHPGRYDVYRLATGSGSASIGTVEQVSTLGGRTEFALSPDGTSLLLESSSLIRPPELYVQSTSPGATATRLTDTVTDAFLGIDWVEPEIVPVPSSHVDAPIWSRFYPSRNPDRLRGPDGKVPAVIFVHGAGYLQNAHTGWSVYFREFMFHTLLAEQGYHVLDMDYRGSKGYGEAWRTAIYRHMGQPELEDLLDGVAWLTDGHDVDAERIGIYGGSYGGFMAFMALFKQPGVFAAGAALRPVTDWAHYNHAYTSNILNTPDVDPEAYERSSPIEFADGLADPLLICAPMLDDNVFFQDSVRLSQKLIELGKTDWEVAIYPVEPHGFRTPSSWLDEYRRIHDLFEEHLAPPANDL